MAPLFFAFRYFTNLPFPGELRWNKETAAASLTWLPFTGLTLGIGLALLEVFFQTTGFPQLPHLRALLSVLLELWMGGALAVDGFGKTCEGFFSGLSRTRRTQLMQESYLSVRGVLGLVFWALGKTLLLAELSLQGGFLYILLFYPCWSRWAISFTACRYAVASDEGMAFFFKIGQKPAYGILSSAFMLLVLMFMPRHFYLAALASFAALLFCCSLVQARLGGQSEGTYGFSAVSAELTFLLFSALSGLAFQRYL